MIKLVYSTEKKKIKTMPQEVQDTILAVLQVLDLEYGKNRSFENDGGYVIVIEKKEDFEELESKNDIDCNDVIPEYVDRITCSSGEVYANSLILCSNEFGISLIILMQLTPQNLKDCID